MAYMLRRRYPVVPGSLLRSQLQRTARPIELEVELSTAKRGPAIDWKDANRYLAINSRRWPLGKPHPDDDPLRLAFELRDTKRYSFGLSEAPGSL